jgi:hypothetical protein
MTKVQIFETTPTVKMVGLAPPYRTDKNGSQGGKAPIYRDNISDGRGCCAEGFIRQTNGGFIL